MYRGLPCNQCRTARVPRSLERDAGSDAIFYLIRRVHTCMMCRPRAWPSHTCRTFNLIRRAQSYLIRLAADDSGGPTIVAPMHAIASGHDIPRRKVARCFITKERSVPHNSNAFQPSRPFFTENN